MMLVRLPKQLLRYLLLLRMHLLDGLLCPIEVGITDHSGGQRLVRQHLHNLQLGRELRDPTQLKGGTFSISPGLLCWHMEDAALKHAQQRLPTWPLYILGWLMFKTFKKHR